LAVAEGVKRERWGGSSRSLGGWNLTVIGKVDQGEFAVTLTLVEWKKEVVKLRCSSSIWNIIKGGKGRRVTRLQQGESEGIHRGKKLATGYRKAAGPGYLGYLGTRTREREKFLKNLPTRSGSRA